MLAPQPPEAQEATRDYDNTKNQYLTQDHSQHPILRNAQVYVNQRSFRTSLSL